MSELKAAAERWTNGCASCEKVVTGQLVTRCWMCLAAADELARHYLAALEAVPDDVREAVGRKRTNGYTGSAGAFKRTHDDALIASYCLPRLAQLAAKGEAT